MAHSSFLPLIPLLRFPQMCPPPIDCRRSLRALMEDEAPQHPPPAIEHRHSSSTFSPFHSSPSSSSPSPSIFSSSSHSSQCSSSSSSSPPSSSRQHFPTGNPAEAAEQPHCAIRGVQVPIKETQRYSGDPNEKGGGGCRRAAAHIGGTRRRRRIRPSSSMLLAPLWSCLLLLLLCFLPLSVAIIFNTDEEPGVRCFCDKQTCGGGTLVCAGKYCLIGVRTDEETGQGRLDQHCVDEPVLPMGKRCARDWKKWSEVCICEENLCNTFAFLRGQIDGGQHDEPPAVVDHHHRAGNSPSNGNGGGGAVQRSLYQPIHHQDDDDYGGGGGHQQWGGGLRERDARQRGGGGQQSRGAPLVLLLVVLPLVVGAFTVLLVFLNYHCKML